MPEEEEDEVDLALQSVSRNPWLNHVHNLTTLASASKRSETVRQKLASPTILKNITALLRNHFCTSILADPALRCIANACIDNNDARDIICSEDTDFGGWATQCVQSEDEGVRLLTTKVLNNVCCDHEASQQLCYREGIHWQLIRFLNLETVRTMSIERKLAGELDGAIDVLFWVSGQKAAMEQCKSIETKVLHYDILEGLLDLPAIWTRDWDIETFATISETMLVFLRDANIQSQIISNRLFSRVWDLLEKQERLIERSPIEEEDRKLLTPLRASLIWCLSDLSAHPAFATRYSWKGYDMRFLRTAIQSAGDKAEGQEFIAASQILGNLLWAEESPQDYSSLILEAELHVSLLNMIALPTSISPDALHSMAGLLVQLSRSSVDVRETIGRYPHSTAAIERLCRHEMPAIKQGGIKLVKALGKDCLENQRRFAELAGEAIAGLQQPAAGGEV